MSLLENLKEFSALLFPDSSEDDTSLETWMTQLQTEISSVYKEDPFCTRAKQTCLIVPKIMNLVRECLSSHRLSELIPLIQQLSQKKPVSYWKTSLEVLYTSDSRVNLVTQLVKELQNVKYLNGHEVLTEFLMFLLHSGRIEDAKQISMEKRRSTSTGRDHYSELLFKAYIGLVWYVEWSSCKAKLEELDSDNRNMVNYSEVMATYAHKAMLGFNHLSEETGVWDIFITKHVEILEFYDKIDEARGLLTGYRDKNKENLNSHRYLYYFYQRNGLDQEQEIDILQDIAKCSPSDSLVLVLINKLVKKDQVPDALKYLFDLLDYPCWQNELQPWKLLEELTSTQRGPIKKAVDDIWKTRDSWWPQYHFNDHGCSHNDKDCQICTCKSVLAVRFTSQNILKDKKKSSCS